LRDPVAETNIRSKAVLSLVSGVALLAPLDDALRPLFTEFLSRIGRLRKAKHCRAIVSNVCGRTDASALLRQEFSDISIRSRSPDFTIQTVSELRICQDLYGESGEFPVQQMSILRADPAAELDVTPLMELFGEEDWVTLVNRVDRRHSDFESWTCLDALLRSERVSDQGRAEFKTYVGGYWPRYHRQFAVPANVDAARGRVFALLAE
jgi:hypothetical protein